jgi:dynein intermediate chain 1
MSHLFAGTLGTLCNLSYHDLFAVGLGSYDFLRQRMGLICLYSIKNTTHPEYSFTTESGVMSLDFHPSSPALLAVGLYDGTYLYFIKYLKLKFINNNF